MTQTSLDELHPCPRCNGSGINRETDEPCRVCQGTGNVDYDPADLSEIPYG